MVRLVWNLGPFMKLLGNQATSAKPSEEEGAPMTSLTVETIEMTILHTYLDPEDVEKRSCVACLALAQSL